MPWALLLALGAYLLLVGLWSFGFVAVRVHRAYPSGPVAMSSATRVGVGRLLLSCAAFVASGLLCWVYAFRCRRGAWRPALYAALLAAALWASFFVLWPGHAALPMVGRASAPPDLALQRPHPAAGSSATIQGGLGGVARRAWTFDDGGEPSYVAPGV